MIGRKRSERIQTQYKAFQASKAKKGKISIGVMAGNH